MTFKASMTLAYWVWPIVARVLRIAEAQRAAALGFRLTMGALAITAAWPLRLRRASWWPSYCSNQGARQSLPCLNETELQSRVLCEH